MNTQPTQLTEEFLKGEVGFHDLRIESRSMTFTQVNGYTETHPALQEYLDNSAITFPKSCSRFDTDLHLR